MKTTIFYFKDINENLGTRQLGKEVREKLIPIIDENDKTIFDFTNVNVVSNSFNL